MKYISSLLLMLCLGAGVSAQDSILNVSKLPRTVYLNEDFIDHRNGWFDFDNVTSSKIIRGGKMYFESKDTASGRLAWTAYNIDPTSDYYLEMEFALVSGPDNYGSGFLFNHTNTKKDNMYRFMIDRKRYFRICNAVDDSTTEIRPWEKCEYINAEGNNRLGIFAKGKQTYFYINGHLVHSMKRLPYLGSEVGFEVARHSMIAIDKFIIRYNPRPVNELEDAAQGYKKVSLGPAINSDLEESFPVLSADGKLMFFSRSVNFGAIGLDRRTIMCSEYNDSAHSWSKAVPLPATINQKVNAQVIGVSPDKRTILLDVSCDAQGRYINGKPGICMSHRSAEGWSRPENIPIAGLANRANYTSHYLAVNNKVLIMSLSAGGGYGERDLYVSLFKDGKWTTPKNMGPAINSFADDYAPCLAPDNVTLYYASFGKPGYGKSDIFMSRRLDDTWLNWTEPKNLGPDINTIQAESWLQVDADGSYAYMNLETPGHEHGEIVKIEVPVSARPRHVAILSGKVYNMITKEPIAASVLYENMATSHEEGTTTSSPDDGSFVIVLPYGMSYGLTASAPGYLAESKTINLSIDTLASGFTQLSADLYLMPLISDRSISLNNIFFAPDEYKLESASFSELNRLVQIMEQNPSLRIEIEGHTDRGGANASAETLRLLSQNRANSVREYLISKGIESKRLTSVGYGNTRPVSTDQSKNRRVEVRITDI